MWYGWRTMTTPFVSSLFFVSQWNGKEQTSCDNARTWNGSSRSRRFYPCSGNNMQQLTIYPSYKWQSICPVDFSTCTHTHRTERRGNKWLKKESSIYQWIVEGRHRIQRIIYSWLLLQDVWAFLGIWKTIKTVSWSVYTRLSTKVLFDILFVSLPR